MWDSTRRNQHQVEADRLRNTKDMDEDMSGLEAATLVKRIDADIIANRASLQEDVLRYLQEHVEELARDLMETGEVRIPTFAGVYTLTENDLREVLGLTVRKSVER